jgi:hypothetical protein
MILLCAALLLLAAGCAGSEGAADGSKAASVSEPQLDEALLGTWVNSGSYENGGEYVETMTVREDWTVQIDLEYEGAPYQTLSGTYTLSGQHFVVTITDDPDYTTDYRYLVDGRQLTLEDDNGTYVYYSE